MTPRRPRPWTGLADAVGTCVGRSDGQNAVRHQVRRGGADMGMRGPQLPGMAGQEGPCRRGDRRLDHARGEIALRRPVDAGPAVARPETEHATGGGPVALRLVMHDDGAPDRQHDRHRARFGHLDLVARGFDAQDRPAARPHTGAGDREPPRGLAEHPEVVRPAEQQRTVAVRVGSGFLSKFHFRHHNRRHVPPALPYGKAGTCHQIACRRSIAPEPVSRIELPGRARSRRPRLPGRAAGSIGRILPLREYLTLIDDDNALGPA